MKFKWLLVLFSAIAALHAGAASTKYFTSSSQNLWDGRPSGVVVYKDGTFSSGPDWAEGLKLTSTPISSFAADNAVYIGTTSPAELLVFRGEKIEKLCSFDEAIVTSITTAQGRIFVGTASPARVYEVDKAGVKKLLVQLEGDVVGCLLAAENGSLLAGTSSPAKVYEIQLSGAAKVIAVLSANYTRCMLKDSGAVYIGTSDPGLLYKIDAADKLVLLDSFEEDEVAGFEPYQGGLLIIANPKKDKAKENSESRCVAYSEGSGSVTVSKLNGPLVSIWGKGGRYYIASSDGRLYFVEKGKTGLVHKFDSQLSLVCGEGNVPYAAFSSPPSLSVPLRSGVSYYESPVINGGGLSRVGTLKADLSGQAKVYLRAGNREKPDDSWSGWLAGPSFSVLAPSRYFQWKYEMKGENDDLKGLTIALRPLNRAPVIEEARVHPPNEIYIKNPSQLADRLVQDIHDKEHPFPEVAASRPFDAGTQTYYLYGFRMISFTAVDPDGDELKSKIEIIPSGSDKPVTLGENIKDNFLTFDARTLPDGVYRVIITSSDSPGNEEGEAQTGERILPNFEVDNTPPKIELIEEKTNYLKYKTTDNTFIHSARVSRDGNMWEVIESEGRVFAQKEEVFSVKVGPKDNWIVFQVADSYGNVSTKAWIGNN